MSTIKANQWLNSDGTENYKCRAWVNFNGVGTIAIRASGNVSSITDMAVGSYSVNFIVAMPDANFACVVHAGNDGSSAAVSDSGTSYWHTTTSTGYIGVQRNDTGALMDTINVSVVVFR